MAGWLSPWTVKENGNKKKKRKKKPTLGEKVGGGAKSAIEKRKEALKKAMEGY